jgi:hypothetical protein
MSPLLQKQILFARSISVFILWIEEQGYGVTVGEFFRPQFVADIYAKEGKGVANSVHSLRLAADLNIFDSQGNMMTTPSAVAMKWESYSDEMNIFRAGLNFKNVDADHFSIEYQGVC